LPRGRLELAGAAVLVDPLAGPLDCVLLGVEEVLHQHDELHLARLVHPVARAVLGRVQEAELALPVPEDVRLEVGQRAHLADRVELLHRSRCGHRHCSALSSRPISSATLSRAGFPRKRTSHTCSVIGSSTPNRAPSAAPAREALAPSATLRCAARYASYGMPCASATPSARLRLSCPREVRIRSPIPARPAKVSGSAPIATPSRVISARPRVRSAARGLWPRPRPSRMPAAMAITFLSAPPSSTPLTS